MDGKAPPPREFIPEGLGSATTVNFSAKARDKEGDSGSSTRGAPWGVFPSLKAMADEVGINFDTLIEGFKNNKSDEELAQELGVPIGTIANLREHFIHYGIDSVMGQD